MRSLKIPAARLLPLHLRWPVWVWVGVLLLWTYIIARAVLVPITFDEAWTLQDYVPQTAWQIVTMHQPQANNHILHTLLVKFLSHFSKAEWVLRLPALISFLVYVAACSSITHQVFFQRVMLRWCCLERSC